jgi:GNAT superfamily N-acetyltransferase
MEPEDIYEVLSVAESAFFDEKLYKWTVPNDNERRVFIKSFFQIRLEAGLGRKFMEVALDDTKKIVAAAIWAPPVEDTNDGQENSSDFDKLFSKFDNGIRERCHQFFGTVMGAEKSFIQPYWALAPIFVHKKMQGKGIASLLIRKQLKVIDNVHLPCILVTQEEKNIPVYERYGFKISIELPINTEIMSYGMIHKNSII